MCIPPVIRISIMNLTGGDEKAVSMNGAEAERAFSGSCSTCPSTYTGDNVISGILVTFVKQIVGYFVFQTEVLDGLTVLHRLRLVMDEQILKIVAAIHI